MKRKIEELSNYRIFSKHRQFLMGVATVFIGIFHLDFFAPIAMHKHPLLYDTVGMLYIGVEIFLFLSGIGLYFAYSKKPKFKDYYIKRILSVYLTFLVINTPYAFFRNFIAANNSIWDFILNASSVSYWLRLPGETRPGWYVVFIMILYLIYPLIYKILNALDSKKHDLIFTVSVSLIFLCVCIFLNERYNDLYFFIEIGLSRMSVFIIGCYVGKLVYNKKQIHPVMYLLMISGIMIKVLYFMSDDRELIFNRFSQCLLSIAIMYLLMIFAEFVIPSFLYKLFEFIGTMSLEFYLTHNLLKDVIKYYGFTRIRHYFIMLAVAFVLSFIISRLRIKTVNYYVSRRKTKEKIKVKI